MSTIAPDARHPLIERIVEQAIFASRWLLAPIYVGLAAGLLVSLVKFVQRTMALLTNVRPQTATTPLLESWHWSTWR
jgi:uncharacterized protein (TIGR00645 family)